jgi:hypothetical protein
MHKCYAICLYARGGQLYSSAGHIEPSFVSRGPHLGHKAYLNATKIGPRRPDVARGPYVAPSCSMPYTKKIWALSYKTFRRLFRHLAQSSNGVRRLKLL